MKIDNLSIRNYMRIMKINNSKLSELEREREILKIFHKDINKIKKGEGDDTIISLSELISQDVDSLVRKFKYDGVEYGFIPNLDNISTGEYIDLNSYLKEGTELHRIAAILYRPITHSKGDMYRIEEYSGTEKYMDIMREVDFRVVISAMFFFSILGKSLLSHSNIYIQRLAKKERKKMKKISRKKRNSPKSSDGIL